MKDLPGDKEKQEKENKEENNEKSSILSKVTDIVTEGVKAIGKKPTDIEYTVVDKTPPEELTKQPEVSPSLSHTNAQVLPNTTTVSTTPTSKQENIQTNIQTNTPTNTEQSKIVEQEKIAIQPQQVQDQKPPETVKPPNVTTDAKPIEISLQISEKQKISNRISQIENQLTDLGNETEKARIDLEKINEDHQSTKKELETVESALGDLQNNKSKAENILTSLTQKQTSENNNIIEQTTKITNMDTQLTNKQNDLKSKEEAFSILQKNLNELQSKVPQEGQDKTQWDQNLAELDTQIQNNQKELEDLKKGIVIDTKTLNDEIIILNTLQDNAQKLNNEVIDQKNKVSEFETNEKSLNDNKKSLTEKITTNVNQIQTVTQQIRNNQSDIEKLNSLKGEYDTLLGLYDIEKTIIDDVNKRNNDIKALQDTIKSYETQLKGIDQKGESLTKDIHSIVDTNDALAKENIAAELIIQKLRGEISAGTFSDQRLNDAQQKEKEAKIKVRMKEEARNEKINILNGNEKPIEELKARLASYNGKIDELQKQINDANTEITNLNNQVEEARISLIGEKEKLEKMEKDSPEYATQQALVNTANDNLEQKSNALKEKELSLKTSTTTQTDLKNENIKTNENLIVFQENHKKLSQEIEIATNALNSAKENHDTATKDVEKIRNELITERNNEIAKLRLEVDNRKNTIESNTQVQNQKTQELQANISQQESVKKELGNTNEKLVDENKALKELEKRSVDNQEKIAKKKDEIQKVDPDPVEKEAQIALAQANEMADKSVKSFNLEDALKNRDKLTKEIEDLKTQHKQQMEKVASLKASDPTKVKEIDDATNIANKLQEKIGKKEEELKKTEEEIKKLEKEEPEPEPDANKKSQDDKTKEEPKLVPAMREKDQPFRHLKAIPKKWEPTKEVVDQLMPSMENKDGAELLGELIAWLFMMLLSLMGEGINKARRNQAEKDVHNMEPMLKDMTHLVDKRNKLDKKINKYKEDHPEPPPWVPRQVEKLAKWEKKLRGYNEGLDEYKKHIQENIIDIKDKRNKEDKAEIKKSDEEFKKLKEIQKEKIDKADENIKQIRQNKIEREESFKKVENLKAKVNEQEQKLEQIQKTGDSSKKMDQVEEQSKAVLNAQGDVKTEMKKLIDLKNKYTDPDKDLEIAIKEKNEAQKELAKIEAEHEKAKEASEKLEGREKKLIKQAERFELQKEGLGSKDQKGGLDLSGKPEPTPEPVPEPELPPEPKPEPVPEPKTFAPIPEATNTIGDLNTSIKNLNAILKSLSQPLSNFEANISTDLIQRREETERVLGLATDMTSHSEENQKEYFSKAKARVAILNKNLEYIDKLVFEEARMKEQLKRVEEIDSQKKSEKDTEKRMQDTQIQLKPTPLKYEENAPTELDELMKELAKAEKKLKEIQSRRMKLISDLGKTSAKLDENNYKKMTLKNDIEELKKALKDEKDPKKLKKLQDEFKEKTKELEKTDKKIKADELKMTGLVLDAANLDKEELAQGKLLKLIKEEHSLRKDIAKLEEKKKEGNISSSEAKELVDKSKKLEEVKQQKTTHQLNNSVERLTDASARVKEAQGDGASLSSGKSASFTQLYNTTLEQEKLKKTEKAEQVEKTKEAEDQRAFNRVRSKSAPS